MSVIEDHRARAAHWRLGSSRCGGACCRAAHGRCAPASGWSSARRRCSSRRATSRRRCSRCTSGSTGSRSGMVTVLFAVYVVALIPSMLTIGRVADRIGRRPLLVGGIGLTVVSSLAFASARSVPWLFAGEIIYGIAGRDGDVVCLRGDPRAASQAERGRRRARGHAGRCHRPHCWTVAQRLPRLRNSLADCVAVHAGHCRRRTARHCARPHPGDEADA